MLELDFQQYNETDRKLDGQSVVDRVLAVRAKHGNRAANKALLEIIGLMPTPTKNEAYYGEALNYHLALIYSRLNDANAVRTCIQMSHTMPAGGGDAVFAEHVLESVLIRERQERAIARGVPSILFTAMPRSASATLATLLSHLLDAPVSRLSVGDFPNYVLVPSWLRIFLEGGAVNHDHFGASKPNLNVLAEVGIRDLFILIRDPRAAAASLVRLESEVSQEDRTDASPFQVKVFARLSKLCLPWLREWMDCAADANCGLRIHWLFWDDVRTRPSFVVAQICEVLAIDHPSVNSFVGTPIPEIRANFVTGDDSSWRKNISDTVQRRMWESLEPDIIDLLKLQV